MRKTKSKRLMQYVIAAIAVLIALLLTKAMERIDEKPTLFIFLGAVMIAATTGGLMSGLFALACSAVVSAFYVMAPVGSFSIDTVGSIVRWLAFQGIGLLIVTLHASRQSAAERLSRSDQRLRLAMDAGRIGVWDYAVESGEMWVSHGVGDLIGREGRWFKPTFEEFVELIHPDDRELFRQTVLRTIEDKVDYEVDFRIQRPDGSTQWLVTRGRGFIAAGTGTRHLVGVLSENNTKHPNPADESGSADQAKSVPSQFMMR